MNKTLQSTFLKQCSACFALLTCFFLVSNLSAQVTVTLDANNPSCGGFSNGSITANASGGWAPYTYEWSNGETTQSIFGLAPGTYTVTATDIDLGFDVATVTLTSPTQTDADITIDDICAGNGNVSVPTSGGVPPYTYNWSDGGSGSTRTGLDLNTQYCVTVLDANLCGVVTCTIVPETINLTVVASDVACSDSCDGSVEAVISGGTAPFSFLWSNGVTSQVNGNILPGTYSVTVTDGNGCTVTGSGTIGAPSPVVVTINSVDPPCGNPTGSASATASGGTPGYTYQWSTGATGSSISGLMPGSYSVTATDANGCESSNTVVIEPSTQVDISLSSTNPTCANPSGGSVTATATNGTPPYSYLWNTGANTATISNLGTGVYSVVVTDAAGCTNSASTTLSQDGATIFASINSTDTSCGVANGSATAEGSGGSGSYSYAWSTGSTNQTITGLDAGSYTVTITDNASGCTAAKTVVINTSQGVNVSVNTMDTNCTANNGTAMAQPNGGTAPYSYIWSNGATSQMITGLTGGTYTVTISDANSCTSTASGTVNTTGSNIILTSTSTDVSCFGGSNGTVGTSVSGGTTPYTFQWNTGQTTATLNGVPAGTYTLTVTDASGCTATVSATVNQASQISLSTNSTDVNCNGGNDGTASVSASGGTPSYTYAWSNGASAASISGLSAGTYTVTVTDVNSCTATAIATVTTGANANLSCSVSVASPISAFGASDGALTAVAVGGTGSYSYAWSNGGSTQTISGLSAGTYSATVTDNTTGCTTVCSAELTQPNAPDGKIGDKVFFDLNGDGINDANEVGVAGVTVTLTGTTVNGTNINLTTTTDGTGMYLFEGLEAGSYKVTFSNLPADYEFTTQNSGNDDENDSDVNPATGMTDFFSLAEGECNLTIDAGIFNPCVCDNFTDPGQICCDQTACGPGYDPAPITSLSLPSGGTSGPIEYVWMKKEGVGPFNESQVTAIPNTNTPSYDPPVTYVTTTYYRCARRGPCCPYIETTGVTIFINEDADANFSGPADNILCQGETYTYTADNISPTATYTWTVQGSATTTDVNATSIDIVWSSNGVYDVMLTVTDNSCTASIVDSRLVTNSPDYCAPQNIGLVIDATVIHSADVEIEMISNQGSTDPSITYAIERSKDGVNFEELGTPNMTNAQYNLFNDVDPLRGRSHYRVSMTDALGNVYYSNTETITIFVGNENTLVYPNPFTNNINYEIKDTFGEDVTVEIISPDGRILRTFTTDKDTFSNAVNTDNLASGVYFLRFQFSSLGVQTYKMLKQ